MSLTKNIVLWLVGLSALLDGSHLRASEYAIVASRATLADAHWKRVVETLVRKHDGSVVAFDKSVDESLVALQQQFPRFTCFVATPGEANGEFVQQVHRLTRRLDKDPFADTRWSILTGFDANNALAIARHAEPFVVRKVAAGTDVALEMCRQGVTYDELVKHKMVEKTPGGEPQQREGPGDTTRALAETLTDFKADLFVTSGHADQRSWMIGFRYRNGRFVSKAGQMYGVDTQGTQFPITSPNPKVYLPIGNCLMGDIDGSDAMALAWMNSCGVKQMIGYVVPTWFGYGGWGCLDYFVEQPGRYTFVEAFHANHHALVHKLHDADVSSQDQRGLKFDRDVVAIYGDPKWEARMADGPRAYEQELTWQKDVYTLTIKPNRGRDSFKPINTNGSQRGWRPMIAFLPHRIQDVKLLTGDDLKPTITDDFILVPNPRQCDPAREYKVVFRARRIPATATAVASIAIAPRDEAPAAKQPSLNVMSWNIRYNNPRDGQNAWEHRKDWAAEIIANQNVDVAGLQEVLLGQLDDLKKRLPEMDVYGAGRDDGKARGEFAPVMYRRDRFELLDKSTFWLSKTPDKAGSRDWDAAITRIASWVKLKDRNTGQVFFVINTHFDHVGKEARAESAALLVKQLREKFSPFPTILTGDFNASPDSVPYARLVAAGTDGKHAIRDSLHRSTKKPEGPNSTWNGFEAIAPDRRIDYVFVTDSVRVLRHRTLVDQRNGRFPSDHLPVVTRLELAPRTDSK